MKPIIALLAVFAAMPAQAVTLNFDDLPSSAAFQSYGGFTFDNFYALDGRTFVPSGYANGVISRENVAYNGTGYAASITGAAPFSLTSAYLTAAWNDGLNVSVTGTLNGAVAFAQSFVLDTAAPLLAIFDHARVDRVTIVSSGGVHHDGYDSGYGTQVAIDDLTLEHVGGAARGDTTVPEPATWALMLAGMALTGGALRQRRPTPA